MAKKSKEIWKVYKNVFSEFTLRTIFKLSSEGHFDELKSPISIGKEANIFSATKGKDKVIVKIYRLESCNFNQMYNYIKQDVRYTNLRKHRRQIIFAWVQREYRNILIARDAGCNVPKPITFKNNIIIEEFIGDKDPAPMLKDSKIKNKTKFLNEIIKNMKKLYKKGLVHADLSQFNILNHKNKPYFIDFSQATTTKASEADKYLKRDIKNIVKYFKKLGLKVDKDDVYEKITK
tara:strand:- start:6736 stop:7437 length:702 start_codon:yes stop_codon:yes gene_type:complete